MNAEEIDDSVLLADSAVYKMMHTQSEKVGYYLSPEGAEFLNELWKKSGKSRGDLAEYVIRGLQRVDQLRAANAASRKKLASAEKRIADLEQSHVGLAKEFRRLREIEDFTRLGHMAGNMVDETDA